MAPKYDLIVVGAGVGGAATALRAAKLGLKTLVIERGRWPGDKNISMNGTYGTYMEALLPGLQDSIPQQKLLWNLQGFRVAMSCSLLKRGGYTNFQAFEMDEPDTTHPHRFYVFFRNQWDKWFSSMLVKEGVELMNSTLVVDVLRDGDGAVKGVITDKGKKIEAPITIAADGTNSIVARKAGLRTKYNPKDIIVMGSMIYELGPGAPQDKPQVMGTLDFIETELVDADEVGVGLVWVFPSNPPNGKRYLIVGGGGTIQPGGKYSPYIRTNCWYLVQRVCQHMLYKSYIDNSTLVHMDCKMTPATHDLGCYGPTYGDGIMVVGDAGIGTIWQAMGVHATWESAIIAADVAKKAIDKGDVSAAALKEYEDRWKQRRWVVDAAYEPWLHGKQRTEDGLAPLLRGLVKATPGPDSKPGYGFVDQMDEFMRDVIFPALANMPNIWPPGLKPVSESAGASPVKSAKISEAEKEWVGKNLSDKVKACVTFTPTKSKFIKVDASKCNGCGLCYKYCLGGVFDMDKKRRKAVVARLETCMECGSCFHICPKDAIEWTYPNGGTGIVCSAPGIIDYWDND